MISGFTMRRGGAYFVTIIRRGVFSTGRIGLDLSESTCSSIEGDPQTCKTE